jgi:5-methylcytosine-specific restriction endonuclease McrA
MPYKDPATRRAANRKYIRRWRERHPERKAAELARHRERNPDWWAASAGHDRVRKEYPSAIVPGITPTDTMAFYANARCLTRQTGIPHEVDHIIPLSRGGRHEPSNLQVLTLVANRRKYTHIN